MTNALEAFGQRPGGRGPKTEPDTPPGPPTRSDVAALLAGVRQDVSNEILRLFDAQAREVGATMGEFMWALAMLQARVLASAEMGDQQVWTAARFAELVQLALPAMIMAVEKAKRADRPPNDA